MKKVVSRNNQCRLRHASASGNPGVEDWLPGRALLARNDGLVVFVMPAQAGIQGASALASGYTAWIPGLALLARNDGGYSLRHASAGWHPGQGLRTGFRVSRCSPGMTGLSSSSSQWGCLRVSRFFSSLQSVLLLKKKFSLHEKGDQNA